MADVVEKPSPTYHLEAEVAAWAVLPEVEENPAQGVHAWVVDAVVLDASKARP